MSRIGDITWESNPDDFLNPSQTEELATPFNSGGIVADSNHIVNAIDEEMEYGLSVEALLINGKAPLNDLSEELVRKMNDDITILENIGASIKSDGNKHTREEVDTYYDKVMEEYNKRKNSLRQAVVNYNNNLKISISGDNSNNNDTTVTLGAISLVNGDDNNYNRVIISGIRDARSPYYDAVESALASVEELYPKPEEANRYRAKWGSLNVAEATVSISSETINEKHGWSSYQDAATAGFSYIMTSDEFVRHNTGYATYQDYLDAMYDKYINNGTGNLEYSPEIKTGSFDTRLILNDGFWVWDTLKYDGEYLEFTNEDGKIAKIPLAVIVYDDKSSQIKYVSMTDEQKEQYIDKVTQYYNDIMNNSKNYSDKFRSEINDRVDLLSILYIDPSSREKIQAAHNRYTDVGSAAYCKNANNISTHSSVVIFSNEFINFDDSSSCFNTDEAYNYMVNTYTHELGHAYANDRMILWDRDNTYVWNNIYDTVANDNTNLQILRDYSVADKKELFADSTDYYYNDPDRLKQVEINFDLPEFNMHFDTLYDYMDYILN